MRDVAAGVVMHVFRRALNDWGHCFNMLFDASAASH